MKKFSIYLAVLLVFSLVVSSCNKEMHGELVSESFSLSTINGLKLMMNADITITKGNEQQILVTGESNIVSHIKQSVSNGIWRIDLDRNFSNYKTVKIDLVVSSLTDVSISGSGDIVSNSLFETDNIVISGSGDIKLFSTEAKNVVVRVSGSGDVVLVLEEELSNCNMDIIGSGDIDIAVNEGIGHVQAEISGSGNMAVSGKTVDSQSITIAGSGDYRSFSCASTNAKCIVSGSGNCKVLVTENLDVKISGSGNVSYKGSPSITSSISGSGNIINAN